MFSARKLLEPPSKRSNGLVALEALSVPHESSVAKRQRLDLWGEPALGLSTTAPTLLPRAQSLDIDAQTDDVLVETPECTVSRVRAVPSAVANEIRRERPTPRQVTNCRVAIPLVNAHGHRTERHVVSYYVLALRNRFVIWQEGSGNTVTLPLPEEIDATEAVYPFLFALYGTRVSLMVVSSRGRVLFWEDVDLPYESVPLSVQIPLQHREVVATTSHASLSVSSSPTPATVPELSLLPSVSTDQDLKSILCWSNLGNVWEIAMEDRRIRVRLLERQHKGFLSGITKTVSQFFFASTSTVSDPSDEVVRSPIKSIRIVPTSSATESRDRERDGAVDKLVLFVNGTLELRSFNYVDAMDCNATTVWRVDANRIAISYFSEQFPGYHLAKVFMVSVPYVVSASVFGLVVAYVCTPRNEDSPKVKYALLHFTPQSTRHPEPSPSWGCVLDYEPVFSEAVDVDEYVDVETVPISNSAFYLVWVNSQPTHFASIQLPVPGQTSVKSRGFSLRGGDRNAALGFSPKVEVSADASDAVKGSVAFILLENDTPSASSGVIVCAATASNMVRVYSTANQVTESAGARRQTRVEDTNALTAESRALGEGLTVQEYASALSSFFHSEYRSNGGPLRISSSDAPRVARAAIGVAYQILDAKASSGLRWGREANQQLPDSDGSSHSIVTPKLVRFQLEEKRARFEEFLVFIQSKCSDVWRMIQESEELMDFLVDGEEKLHAAVALCKFQGSIAAIESEGAASAIPPKLSGQVLLRAIERAVHQRGYEKEQLRVAGYNSFDIFYCEVSKIHEAFVALSVEIQRVAAESGEGNSDFVFALLESGYSMQSLLKAPTSTKLGSTGKWMFTRPIREAIADQISRLSNAIGFTGNAVVATAEEVFEIAEQIQKLGSMLLNAYQRFLPITSGEAAEDLKKEVEITKRLTLNPLVYIATDFTLATEVSPDNDQAGSSRWLERKKAELFDISVKMAEQFTYYDAMIHLAYREDETNLAKLDYIFGRIEKSAAAKRLESYCKTLPDFADVLLRWFGGEAARYPWSFDGECARSQMFSYMLAHPNVFGSQLFTYLKSRRLLSKYAWTTAVVSEKFEHVAHLTLKEAVGEQESLSKRKTFASIAKIASLAGSATPMATQNEINRELSIGRIQEILTELPINLSVGSRPLSPVELIRKSLEAMHAMAAEDPLRASVFLVTIEALEAFPRDTSPKDFASYCVQAWRECILADEELWSQLLDENAASVNEHKMESLMRCTLVFKTMAKYVSHRRDISSDWSAGLTVDIIDDMVAREPERDSIVGVRSRPLLVKTLNLARAP